MAAPRIVIVGGGFGGLSAAKALRNTPAEIILIDRRRSLSSTRYRQQRLRPVRLQRQFVAFSAVRSFVDGVLKESSKRSIEELQRECGAMLL